MARAGRLRTTAAALLLCSSGAASQSPGSPSAPGAPGPPGAGLERVTFALDGTDFELALPRVRGLSRSGGAVAIRAAERLVRFVQVGRAKPGPVPVFDRQRVLDDRRVFLYRLDPPDERSGSGGPEAGLVGRLETDGIALDVVCHDQGEWPGPDAGWCLPYLHTLRVARAGP